MESCIAKYYRVSLEDFDLRTNTQKDESNSIFAQRKLIDAYIQEDRTLRDLPVVEFSDDGFTGTNFERPGFQRMLELIKNGHISCVIVKDLSRFGRNYLEVGDYLEHLFPFLGVRFVSINDNYDSADYAGTNVGIDIAFKNILHDYYSRDLSIKVRTAQRARMATGKYVNVPPYGYKCDPKDKHHLILDHETAPIVRTIFTMIIEGKTSTEVAYYLNSKHTPTPLEAKGTRRRPGMLCEKPLMWSHITVLNILSNYKYTGAMVNHSRESQTLRAKSQKRLDPSEWIVHEGMHDAIVTHEEFHKARQALRQVKAHPRKEPETENCVYYCAHCGRRLRKTYGNSIYLSCATFKYLPDAECKTIRWTLPDLEALVFESFKVQLLYLQARRKAIKPKEQEADLGKCYISDMARLKANLDQCQEHLVHLYTDYKLGKLSRDDFIIQKAAQAKEKEFLLQLVQQARDQYEAFLAEKAKSAEIRAEIEKFSPQSEMTKEELVKLMYQGIDRVLVSNDGTIEIQWRFQNVFKVETTSSALLS